jgi:hypothetical protein
MLGSCTFPPTRFKRLFSKTKIATQKRVEMRRSQLANDAVRCDVSNSGVATVPKMKSEKQQETESKIKNMSK